MLGRAKSARGSTLDGAPSYRNGYGKPRRLTLSSGTIQVRRPRVRNVEERFESRVLPLFARKSKKVADLIPELYLMIAEKRFRRLKAPRLMRDVYLGTLYMDGMAIEATVEEVAA